GGPAEDDRVFLRRVLRAIDVGGEPDAVAHREHDLAVDHGERIQLPLDVPAAGLRLRGERPALRARGTGGGKEQNEGDEGYAGCARHGVLRNGRGARASGRNLRTRRSWRHGDARGSTG